MLEWIVSASLLIILVILLRKLPIAPWQRYALWLVVLVRLLIPVQLFSLPITALPLPDVESAMEEVDLYAIRTGKVEGIPQEDVDGMLENFQPGEVFTYSYTDRNFYLNPTIKFSVQYNTGCGVIEEDGVYTYALYANLRQVLSGIYVVGAATALLALLCSNLHFYRKMKRIRQPLADAESTLPVYLAEGLPSPCLFGVFHPAIYLTPEAAEDQTALSHILAHEETHYRHGDHIWSLLRCIALAIHWWNPLVWAAVVLSRRDGELCCDASTLERLGDGARRAYGETLLAMVSAKPGPRDLLTCSTTMTSGKRGLQERIRWIAQRPKILVSVSVLVVLAALAAVGCAFGRPAEAQQPTMETTPQTITADVTHDGTPDSLSVTYQEPEDLWLLTITDGATEEQIWSEEGSTSHAGWNALFLCTLEGEEYLLRYTPTMYQGQCQYRYELFWLENGQPVTAEVQFFDFDIFNSDHFDTTAILTFLEKVNDYLSHSRLLMNTDENLISTFARLGRLEDDLWWLVDWEAYAPEESTGENLSRYAQWLQAAQQLGEQVSTAYERLSVLPFTAMVEGEDGQQWTYTIHQGNAYNVSFVGNYLPVSYTWSQAEEGDWNSQQGYLLTLSHPQSSVSLSVRSGGNVVRIEEDGTFRYLRASAPDSTEPEENWGSDIYRHFLIILDDAIGQAVWDNAVVDGSVTDLETVAAALTEQIAQGYRELPDFLEWKPNDAKIQENDQRVFDAWYGENPNFCFTLGLYVGITDPMAPEAFHWQVGSGLSEQPAFDDFYAWGQEVLVVLDQEANLWRIRDRGTGGYTAALPFDLATASVSDLVSVWTLTEGFTHNYLLFYYLGDKSLTELADLNEPLDQLSREEAEAFLLGFKAHKEEYYHYYGPTLADIATVLDSEYADLLS